MTSDSEREIFMNGINFNPAQGNKTDDFVEKTVEYYIRTIRFIR